MQIEFRVGKNDRLVMEDFLAERRPAISAIVIEEGNTKFQRDLAEGAKALGIDVVVDPLTDRMLEPNYRPKGDFADKYPIETRDLRRLAAQAELVQRVLDHQSVLATTLIPPYFYAETPELVELDLALAGMAVQVARAAKKPLRAVLSAPRSLLSDLGYASHLAIEYQARGVEAIELRLSPLGNENDGPPKIRSALAAIEAFSQTGLQVVLGLQASVGQTALALGLVHSYSTGIGYREQFNHASTVANYRQKATPKKGFAPASGVYLPSAEITVPRRVAEDLYSDTTIRSRLVCTIGRCAADIRGPVNDPRTHYLHSRTALIDETRSRPERWRPAQELLRLTKAIDFRENLNRNYLAEKPLKLRATRALASEIEKRIGRAKSA